MEYGCNSSRNSLQANAIRCRQCGIEIQWGDRMRALQSSEPVCLVCEEYHAGKNTATDCIKFSVKTGAVNPEKAHQTDAGFDLFAFLPEENVVIGNLRIKRIPSGVISELPPGYHATVRGRSGNNLAGIIVLPGTIDNPYRGDIGITVLNLTGDEIVIRHGQKLAQVVIERDYNFPISFVSEDQLSSTDRGDSGYGSTGNY